MKDKVYPFLYFISEPFMAPFRFLVPLSINGFDLAVFPAFAGVLFIIAVTGLPVYDCSLGGSRLCKMFGLSLCACGICERELLMQGAGCCVCRCRGCRPVKIEAKIS